MCGIVGVIGSKDSTAIILEGLKKLEYRGYDSAGITVLQDSEFKTTKEQGKIAVLENSLKDSFFDSLIGIGHTRWATHGAPSKKNAHPHSSSKVCVVHNGIIENHQELKEKLQKNGVEFLSETDTEVVPHLIEYYYEQTSDIKESLIRATKDIVGSFAFAVMFRDNQNVIAVAKRGSPLVVGLGSNQNYVASDYYALSSYTNEIINLDDDEFGLVLADKIEVFDQDKNIIKKEAKIIESEKSQVSKEGYEHFMLKEIFEQPKVLQETIETYVDLVNAKINLTNFPFDLAAINKITLVACGTSYYAALAAKYLIEKFARVEVEVDIASEFRYRDHPFRDDNLMIFVSQSGETADTLAALKYAKENGQKILSIVNAPYSSMANLSDVVIRTVAGPEIGVASTKAYTAQISILSLLAIDLADKKGAIDQNEKQQLLAQLANSSSKMVEMLGEEKIANIKEVANSLKKANHVLYIGRSISQVSAFESALKFRELSYIDAQGIAAGELKHGTIALIDSEMPVIVIAPSNNLFEKTLSNAIEVHSRDGKIIFISDKKGLKAAKNITELKIEIPEVECMIQEAILPVIATQLLAYYVAYFKGNDIDQPRNLAKSVTVE